MKLYDATRSTQLRRATIAAAILGCAGGWASALVASSLAADPDVALAIAAFLLGAAALATPAIAAGLVLHGLGELQLQVSALVSIRPLLGDLPLPVGRWAIDAHFGEIIARTIAANRPGLVVECGSGTSTVLAAECLRRLGRGRLLSFEHDPAFAEETRRRLAERGLDGIATVVTAPIARRRVEGEDRPWYGEAADACVDGAVDLLVVDGPPRQLRREARYPAVPLLRDRLAPRATILMDDGNRPDESRIAESWARQLPAARRFERGGKGCWILRVEKARGGAVPDTPGS